MIHALMALDKVKSACTTRPIFKAFWLAWQTNWLQRLGLGLW